MVLPLLAGATALMGGAQLGRIFMEDYAQDRDISRASERQQAVLDNLGAGYTGDQFNRAAFGAGIMDPETYGRQGFADARQAADNAAAMARQRVSSGPAYMNAALARERFEWEQAVANDAAAATAEEAALVRQREDMVLAGAGYNPVEMGIPSLRADALKTIGAGYGQPEPQLNPVIEQGVQEYGPAWRDTAPDIRQEVAQSGNELARVEEAARYFDETTAADRALDRGTAARMASQFKLDGTNFLRKYMEAGALQEADLAFMTDVLGDPTGWTNLTDSQKGRVQNILRTMREGRSNMLGAYGLTAPAPRSPSNPSTGGALEPVSVGDILRDVPTAAPRGFDSTFQRGGG